MKKTKLVWEDGTWLFKTGPEEIEIAKFPTKDEALKQAPALLRERALVPKDGERQVPVTIKHPDGTVEEHLLPLESDGPSNAGA